MKRIKSKITTILSTTMVLFFMSCEVKDEGETVLSLSTEDATSAAKADDDEARPVPAGKSLRLTTQARVATPARDLIRSRCATTRSNDSPTAGLSSIVTASTNKPGRNSTVVTVVKAARFIERDGFAGRLSVSSILPQYLMKAMFGLATAVALLIGSEHPSSQCGP